MMTPDEILAERAQFFGVSLGAVRAVYLAEGGTPERLLRAVAGAHPKDFHEAVEILCRSAAHAAFRFLESDPMTRGDFITFWGATWAPIGAANDPSNLNAHWTHNVAALWEVKS